ncbi:ferredoxin family protein [Natranaerofaba carboxydovora]|uniref:ferredoxin family protein n=1 Tax=Natranaerofaba carboxydovora TaxID=2742683 RepID=UPI001F1299E1|nr:4Fe-4S dicluster domain-containing protein [Natranaerofaba carboxydovora]UMZ75328.1 Electron transfer flavoprotein-ubiquinone oxidoreductase, 4Fe-4S [Natranaerofaba carboxydovora]
MSIDELLNIDPAPFTHIKIRNPELCKNKCEKTPCTYICPSDVYYTTENKSTYIQIDYERCVECGACIIACPYENIDWHYPPPEYGVFYQF